MVVFSTGKMNDFFNDKLKYQFHFYYSLIKEKK